jgi:proteasome accessory factor B
VSEGPSRSERVLNLLALLLDRSQPITRLEILTQIGGYAGDSDAGRRAFERDKEMLRNMGVPLRVVQARDSDEPGYTVDPDEYYLPDLGLSDAETAALRVAVSAVALGTGAGEGALLKLGTLADHATAPIAALPLVPQLAPLFEAVRRRCAVRFSYQGARRHVEPWALVSRRGRWYVVGLDRDRAALRTFRADRVGRDVKLGPPGAYAVPADFRPDDVAQDAPWQFGEDRVTVRVAVDAARVDDVVRALGPDADTEPGRDDGRQSLQAPEARPARDTRVVRVEAANLAALRSLLLEFGDSVEVLEPLAFRADMIAWLEAVVRHSERRR